MKIKLFKEYYSQLNFSQFNVISDNQYDKYIEESWLKLTDKELSKIQTIFPFKEDFIGNIDYKYKFYLNYNDKSKTKFQNASIISIIKLEDDYYIFEYRIKWILKTSILCDQFSELLKVLRYFKSLNMNSK